MSVLVIPLNSNDYNIVHVALPQLGLGGARFMQPYYYLIEAVAVIQTHKNQVAMEPRPTLGNCQENRRNCTGHFIK